MPRTALSLPFDGKLLRAARERAGFNQEGLAQACRDQGTDVSRFQVVRAETGKCKPQPDVLQAFVTVLNLNVDDLLTGGDQATAESA